VSKQAHKVDGLSLGLKIGIASALTIGAVASGYVVSRTGRRVLREAMQGRRRSRLEDRVLERLWEDRDVGRCDIDVEELEPGRITVTGRVRSEAQHARALELVRATKDVGSVEDRLRIEPPVRLAARERMRRRIRMRGFV
jgi:osmotically-inducible protein OsmY